jgi:hypothetical protein
MTSRRDEVEARMNSLVLNVREASLDHQLLLQTCLELRIDEIDDDLRTFLLVQLIAKPSRLNNAQLDIDVAVGDLCKM